MEWLNDMDETRGIADGMARWGIPQANLVMDVHGDPVNARLVVFSDGNHHMALRRTMAAFEERTPDLRDICFLTTPPGPLLKMIQGGKLVLGNLALRLNPHVFISPPHVLDKLVGVGQMNSHVPFCRNRGSVLLVKRSNPKKISAVTDLATPGFRLFLSNPDRERDSRKSYEDTLKALSGDEGFLEKLTVVSGQVIHHREALDAIDSGKADGAMLFFHLARHYSKTFADRFEMIPLGRKGVSDAVPSGCPVNTTHAGIVGDGGALGQAFLEFLFSPRAQAIYRDCGLDPLPSPFA